jgi:hypothetical protein
MLSRYKRGRVAGVYHAWRRGREQGGVALLVAEHGFESADPLNSSGVKVGQVVEAGSQLLVSSVAPSVDCSRDGVNRHDNHHGVVNDLSVSGTPNLRGILR